MKIIRLWAPAIVWMTVIFLLSSRERVTISDQESVNFIIFKTLHMFEYALLFLLYFRAIKYTFPKLQTRFWYVTAYVAAVGFAASDEIHQTFVPTRGGMARDVIIDAAGVVISWIFIKLLLQKAPLKLRTWVLRMQIV